MRRPGPVEEKPRLVLTWGEIDRAINDLAERLRDAKFKRIVGVARGGLAPAAMLAHRLDIRRVESVLVVSREPNGRSMTNPILLSNIEDEHESLFIDDIADSGKTHQLLARQFPRASFAVLVSKVPQLVGVIKAPHKAWIQFPWEVE